MTKRPGGTVALVTGASSGIGAATARALAAEGASVAVAARRKDRLDHLAASTTPKVLAIQADLTDLAQADRAVERTVAECGRLDTLVNNAGVMFLGAVADAPVSEWDHMIAHNVQALITTTRGASSPPAGGRRLAARHRRHHQRQFHRRPYRPERHRGLQPHQVRYWYGVTLVGLNHNMGNRGTVNTVLEFGDGAHSPRGRSGAVGLFLNPQGDHAHALT
jgi:NAD(P)-dependent dehydrogenase (short-subunit alcohol dehydrogenase family)